MRSAKVSEGSEIYLCFLRVHHLPWRGPTVHTRHGGMAGGCFREAGTSTRHCPLVPSPFLLGPCPFLPLALSVCVCVHVSLCSPLFLSSPVRVSGLLGSCFLYWCKPRAAGQRWLCGSLFQGSWDQVGQRERLPGRTARPLRICPPPSPLSTVRRGTAAVWAAAWRGLEGAPWRVGLRAACMGECLYVCF